MVLCSARRPCYARARLVLICAHVLFRIDRAEINKRQQERAGAPSASADAGYKAMMKNFDK